MMKKVVLSFIIFLIFPIFALADDGFYGPAKVINSKGTDVECDGKKVHLPYDIEVDLKVIEDYDLVEITFQDMECNAKIKDFRMLIGDYNFSYDGINEVVIVNNNTKLLNGPDLEFTYTSNKMIPKGTKLLVQYSYGDFAYVTYENESGWILYDFFNVEDDNYAKLVNNNIAIISSDATVYSKDNGIATKEIIKAHTMVHLYYGYDNWFYINYEGRDIWINIDPAKVAYKFDNKNLNPKRTTYKSFETIDVYTGSKVTIPANANINLAYQNHFIYNVCGKGAIDYAYYDSYLIYLEDCIYFDYKNPYSNSSNTNKKDDSKRDALYFVIFIPVGALLASSIFVFTKKGKNNK